MKNTRAYIIALLVFSGIVWLALAGGFYWWYRQHVPLLRSRHYFVEGMKKSEAKDWPGAIQD